MKTHKNIKVSISVSNDTWKALQRIRINGDYGTLDEVIKVLLGDHK